MIIGNNVQEPKVVMAHQKTNQIKNKTHKSCVVCGKELEVKHFATPRTRTCEFCKNLVKIKKLNRKEIRKAGSKPKISDLKKTVQKVVNAYIRKRDKDKPCISCQKIVDKKEAGHFIAQGSSGKLRYNLKNIHGQCRACNHFKSGNLLEYRIALVKKIGKRGVERLEDQRHDTHKYTREELEGIMEQLKEQK